MSGVASGFEGIDRLTGGFQKANLIVLAARPGVGKTSLALNVAQNVAVQGQAPVAIFSSFSMSAQELGERMMCLSARGQLAQGPHGHALRATTTPSWCRPP